MAMTSCDDGSGKKNKGKKTPGEFTVTFNSMGGSDVPPQTTDEEKEFKITRPSPSPTKDDFIFDNWYKDEACTQRWNFIEDTVTRNITLYAGWKPDQGTEISKIIINGIDFDNLAGARFGNPVDSLQDAIADDEGVFEPGRVQPDGGSAIQITAKNKNANAKWAAGSAIPAESAYGTTTPITFNEGDKLYVKVTNGEFASYYKINIYFIIPAIIYYGQPVINGSTLDPIWGETNPSLYNGPDLQITRIATNEVTPNFKFLNTADGAKAHTLGKAKAYWDDEGLYIYATIEFHDYYANPTDKTNGTSTARVTQLRGNYESDSLEIMLNTRYQKFIADGTTSLGQQFRVGFSDGDAGQAANTFPSKSDPDAKFVIGSGNHNGLPTGVAGNDILAAFRSSGEFYAWITKNGAKETGYKIVCRVPWYLIGYENTDQVFDATTGQVKANANIGLEFQLNTSTTPNGSAPTRDGLLTWNSVTSQGVSTVKNYGVITLAIGSKPRNITAHLPTITTQPRIANGSLSVTAIVGPKVPTGNTLSYQWYKADNASSSGTPVTGATDATLTLDSPASGKWFYVVVTNTNNSVSGTKTASVTSIRVEDKNVAPDIEVPNPVIEGVGGATDTGGVFTLDSGSKGITYKFPSSPADLLTTYKTIKVDYTADNTSAAGTTMKIVVKQGYNSTSTDIPSSQYKNLTATGSFTFNLVSDFPTNKDGFTFQMNSDDGTNGSAPHANFTIKIDKITFSAQ